MGYINHLSFRLIEVFFSADQATPTIYIVSLAFIINDMAIIPLQIKYFNDFGDKYRKYTIFCHLIAAFYK